MLRLTVDGMPVDCPDGSTLLAAIRAAGADVPTLCDDPRLAPIGACRMCLVRVRGWPHPVTACNTIAADGMEVQTHAADLEQARRTILHLLAADYPLDAVERDPQRSFHRYLKSYGVDAGGPAATFADTVDDSHPYLRVDMSQCIHCFRCVRICEEVQGQNVWRVWNRGDRTDIRPDSGTTLACSSCVSCGACADTCPTGAIRDKPEVPPGPVDWTRTTCPYCGTGCEMNVGAAGGRIVSVKPVLDAPVSKGHLCVKGRYAWGFNHAPDRWTEPMLKVAGRWRAVPWDEAIAHVACGLRRIIDRHGPDAVGVLGSARGTNEENYVAQKFARVVVGTNNVDCCARVCHAPTATGMKVVLGTGAATNSFDDIESASTILVFGANPTENHPIVGARIRQAVRRGAKLIVVDPRRTELAACADLHLAARPGTNVPLLNAMACAVVEEGLWDRPFVDERVGDWDAFCAFVREWTPERAADACGVAAADIRAAARLYATHRPSICFHGLGVTEHVQGTDGVICLVNLALITGNVGRPGTGVNPLRGQNNVQGAAHMGCEPGSLTGALPLGGGRGNARDFAPFEAAWNALIPKSAGLNLMRMIDAAAEGRLKALWAIGYDVALTNPNASATRRALSNLEMLVVQDLFHTQIADLATVFLPAASAFEKEGTFMNAERRVQRVRRAVPPPGQARPDWQTLCDVARAMGHGAQFPYTCVAEIWEEIRGVWPAGRGITYERLERSHGIQWPCPDEGHPGTALLHAETFAGVQRATLQRVEFDERAAEATSEEFPFLLNSGRTLYQFNAGTMTGRTPNLALRPGDTVEVSPADAERLGLSDGDRVRLRSRHGQATLCVAVTGGVRPGELFATFHTPDVFLNELTGDRRDRRVDTPAYKVTAVALERG